MRNMLNRFWRSNLELRGPKNPQERPQNWSPKLPRGAFCGILRADSESADEVGDRGVLGREIAK
eukprot:7751834-Alexandrium_andersonii.AAC.1